MLEFSRVVSFCGDVRCSQNEHEERKWSNQHHAKMNIITLLTQAINACNCRSFCLPSQKNSHYSGKPFGLWEIFVIKMVYVNKIFEQVAESCLLHHGFFVYSLFTFYVDDAILTTFSSATWTFNRYENCFPKTFHRLHRIQWLFKLHPYFFSQTEDWHLELTTLSRLLNNEE